uniref:E3 ubiquitin-protein ligase n=1 Tax=Mesocestoides corti TaxID=53468 RepID=A0A5K3F2R3_MESCO
MAGKRATQRTTSIGKQNKGLPHRYNSRPELRKQSARLGQPSPSLSSRVRVKTDYLEPELTRGSRAHTKRRIPSASDLSSESSIIETPRSSEQACPSAASSDDLTAVGCHSKRRRVEVEEDCIGSLASIQRRRNCTQVTSHCFAEVFGAHSQEYPSTPIIQTLDHKGPSNSNREQDLPVGFPNRGKTGSCNSKKLRGKGHVGASSTGDPSIIDQHQQVDFGFFSPTSHPTIFSPTSHPTINEMPADFGELSQKSSATKVLTRGAKSRNELDLSGGGNDGGGGGWFRSFTCFANNTADDQTAIDLSGSSSSASKMTLPAGSAPVSSFIPDGIDFTNPPQPTTSHDLSNATTAGGGGLLRFVTSFSSSSSSSSRQRQHRNAPSTRQDAGKRGLVVGGGRSGGRGGTASSGGSAGGAFASHHHNHHHGQGQQQGSGINYRTLQLQQSFGDVSSQLVILQEINQALLMGSEESLVGLAVHNLVSVIVDLLGAEKSLASLPDEEVIELKNLICNILAHLMDVMPKAADAVVMAIPLLLSTMSSSFVGDILERIINVLEQVSRRHGRQVLLYGGVATVMGYYDFVTVAQHRTILSMVANCFADVRREDFSTHIASCLPSLCDRLACEAPGSSTEPRCVERVCLCFARLIEAYKWEPEILRQIASFGLCQHLKQLIAASPPIVSNMQDIACMLATLCTYCPDLAVDILKLGYAETLYTLLTDQRPHEISFLSPNTTGGKNGFQCTSSRTNIARALENRGPKNISAIIHLISALLPPVHENAISLSPPLSSSRDDSGSKSTPEVADVRVALIQQQCKAFEELVSRAKRKTSCCDGVQHHHEGDGNSASSVPENDDLVLVKAIHLLLPMLFDLYAELNGISPRLRCIEAIHRIVYYASPFVLSWTVSPRSVSAMVAGMLASPEFAIIAAGLQLANLFITRIPLVFSAYFRKEGVLFHLKRLASLAAEKQEEVAGGDESATTAQVFFPPSTSKSSTSLDTLTDSASSYAISSQHLSSSLWTSNPLPLLSAAKSSRFSVTTPGGNLLRRPTTENANNQLRPQPVQLRPPRRSHRLTLQGASANCHQQAVSKTPDPSAVPGSSEPPCGMLVLEDSAQVTPESPASSSTSSSTSTLDVDLGAEASQILPSPILAMTNAASGCQDTSLRAWITSQCQELHNRIQELVTTPHNSDTLASKAAAASKKTRRHSAVAVTTVNVARDLVPELEAVSQQLLVADDPIAWIGGLKRLATLLTKTNATEDEAPSPFEIQRSGLLKALHSFLSQLTERRLRAYLFLRVFVGTRYTDNICLNLLCEKPKMLEMTTGALEALHQPADDRLVHDQAFPILINCLLDCLHQQEHFQVLTGPTSLSSAEACAEEMLLATHRGGIPSSLLLPTGGVALSDTRLRRSGGTSNRSASSKSSSGQPHRLLPRRWSAVVPGFLKLELVRQVEESTTATSSRKSSSENDGSLKGTFWENTPLSLPLHVNALITALNLQLLLVQRSFLASLVSVPENSQNQLVDDDGSGVASFSHPAPHQQPYRRRLYRRQEPQLHPEEEVASSSTKIRVPHHSTAPDSIRHDKLPAQSSFSRSSEVVELVMGRESASSRTSALKPKEAFSRPKSMSLLAAFGMLQFSGSSSSSSSGLMAAAPSFLAPSTLSPSDGGGSSLQPSSSTATHSHNRSLVAGGRRDNSHHHHPASSRYHHHPHSAFMSSGVSDLFGSVAAAAGGNNGLVPVFYINGTRVPGQMPLYQAIRMFSVDVSERSRELLNGHRFSMTEQNREDQINAFMWRHVHTVQYRLEKAASSSSSVESPTRLLSPASLFLKNPASSISSGASASSSSKLSPTSHLSSAISCLKRPRRPDDGHSQLVQSTTTSSRFFSFLDPIVECNTLSDGYLSTNLLLLRALYGLSEVGNTLDDLIEPFPIIPVDHFRSQKLSAKALRQLQDAFCVLAGNLPNWLVQMISTCPFLFPFSVRQNFFYVHNFDRDRTILHLQDSIMNGSVDSESPGSSANASGVGTGNAAASSHPSSPSPRLPHQNQASGLRLGAAEAGNTTAAVLESLLVDSASQVQRHKITVHRDAKRLLRAAESALSELRDSRSILEIAFEGEVGFGLGPTLEFYTLVSHQLMTANLNLWHGHNFTAEGYIIAPAPGLYPRPLAKNVRASQSREVRAKFFFLGQLMARSLLDLRHLDLSLSPTLFKWFLYTQTPEEDLVLCGPRVGVTPADIALVDPQLAKHFRSLMKMSRRRQELGAGAEEEVRAIDSDIEDLCLNFTLPGYQIELCRNGSQTSVTGSNLAEYLHLCANWLLVEGVRRQITALIEGFDSVLPGIRTGKLAALFRPDECEGLFCGSGGFGGLYRDQLAFLQGIETSVSSTQTVVTPSKTTTASGWDVDTLMKSCLCDHGYTLQSKAIQNLFEIMSEFDEPRRRLFIQFATGSPRLPIGGFRALKPPLKIVMKREAEEHADRHLPSVMTCQNYLKLPNYSTKEIMREKLLYAIHEGQHAFHLS